MSQFDDYDSTSQQTTLKKSLIDLANSNMSDDQIKQLLRSLIGEEKKYIASQNSQWGDR
ncbi:MAG TPA: hypothetical protein VFM18_13800 [Methanosarcina sp.]|nr:hypothetical protein [Methanosarcina sp.]